MAASTLPEITHRASILMPDARCQMPERVRVRVRASPRFFRQFVCPLFLTLFLTLDRGTVFLARRFGRLQRGQQGGEDGFHGPL